MLLDILRVVLVVGAEKAILVEEVMDISAIILVTIHQLPNISGEAINAM